jgi:hypothetical protein
VVGEDLVTELMSLEAAHYVAICSICPATSAR